MKNFLQDAPVSPFEGIRIANDAGNDANEPLSDAEEYIPRLQVCKKNTFFPQTIIILSYISFFPKV